MKAVIAAALAESHVREEGTNRGPRVEEYLRSVDNPPGAPWCAAFVYFIIEKGVGPYGHPVPYVKSAYCPTVLTWAEDLGIVSREPLVGDAFLLTYGGRPRHTGFVTRVDRTEFGTVEGNASLEGSSEGDGVYSLVRDRVPSYRFVRWSQLLPQAGPAGAQGRFALLLDGRSLGEIPVLSGRALCPVRRFGDALRLPVAWDHARQIVFLGNRALPSPVTILDGVGHVPIRTLATFAGKRVEVDAASRTIRVS